VRNCAKLCNINLLVNSDTGRNTRGGMKLTETYQNRKINIFDLMFQSKLLRSQRRIAALIEEHL
jgi:hypothetical protein